ncbi:hypothetical protein PC116_g6047 [Phytophthora cactorum]|uniref:Uncharacterized protein n=1 Tax=Phytophthora cactorum TaxID=29920 RepID=A0A8T1CIU0_9STRA|nr:hypothetical protein Pcac1_g23793 [Phytophthora cactorum]KAG2921635.1 hypothetical protein PC117_g16164 [Phytophthora cactorum]KAG4049131.1 hypothetical protein PC123_g15586 [Phytophthora cactorum]KAG4246168.1 hypothetical protein PC116_g6047 [Phytophthora cactorum]
MCDDCEVDTVRVATQPPPLEECHLEVVVTAKQLCSLDRSMLVTTNAGWRQAENAVIGRCV